MAKTLLIIEKNPAGSIGLKKAKERGLNVILLSSNKYQNKPTLEDKKYIDKLIEVDTNDLEVVFETAKKINEKIPLDGAMTFMEFCVPQAAFVANKLGLPGLNWEDACCARNKYLMRERLAKKNVAIPKYEIVTTLEDAKRAASAISYPNVIKPTNLAGSRYVFKNNNVLELEDHFYSTKGALPAFGTEIEDRLLLEEYMDGPEFSVESVSYKGKIEVAAITKKIVKGKNTFVEVGHVVPASIDEEIRSEIKKVAIAAITALGIHTGLSHTEIKVGKDGPKIVEVGARLGGGHIPELVELALGIDLWNASLSIALDEMPQILPQKHEGASIAFITAQAGKIESIKDLGASALGKIHDIHISAKVGDQVNTLSSSDDRLGFIIATGKNATEAELNAKKRMDFIKILTN